MNTSIQTFQNSDFGTIRTVTIDNEPWFVGKDVAEILGYERPTKAVVDHVDEDDRLMLDGKTQSQFGIELGQRGGWIINESGLYSLILSSKLPTAKQFKRWVTSEVLPAIRKNGYYGFFKEGKEQTIIRDRESRSRIAEIWLALSDKVKSETDFIPFKLRSDLLRPVALQGHAVNPSNHLGGFVIYDPSFRIVGIFDVTVGRLPFHSG